MKIVKEDESIDVKDLFKRIIIYLIGMFILAMNYNIIIVPKSFVIGGASGIAVILNKVFGFNPVICIYVISFILVIFSMYFLGKVETRRAILGSLLYPTMIFLTSYFAKVVSPYFEFNNILVSVILAGCFLGLGNGLIYKVGFNTGGGDILMKLVNKYFHVTEGSASLICNATILSCGLFVFGFNTIIYSIIVLFINTELVDRILIGISDSKMFFIYSKKYKFIKEYIMKELNTGVTIFNTEGGFLKQKGQMLMVVVPTRDYYRVKEKILSIDEDAFFIVSDCYEVNGGIKRKNLPFI